MNELKEIITKRIDELLAFTTNLYKLNTNTGSHTLDENPFLKSIYGTLGLLKTTYGEKSIAENTLSQLKDKYIFTPPSHRQQYAKGITDNIKAILENLKAEIDLGLLSTLENRAVGEIFGDMISMAKALFNDGRKEASSVLACGALEDSLKKFALQKGLNVYDTELAQVVNALKSGGHIKGTQAGLAQSFVQLRNRAFHAQFDKIEMPEVASLISFVEQFLLQNFK